MALVASAMLASCGQATPQVGDQSWTTDQPTQLCVDQQGNRVPESECANQRVRTGYRPNYLWYYMMRGNRVPAYGEHIAVGQGSYQPVAATRYTPASTVETAAISRGGFGQSAGARASTAGRGGFGSTAHGVGGGHGGS